MPSRTLSLPISLRALAALLLCALTLAIASGVVRAEDASPFDKLAGRWVGEGRLGVKDGNTELVKCRVTYQIEAGGNELRQSIRCASQGGNIEVVTHVTHADGKLAGTWKELTRDWSGDIEGVVNPFGFKVTVKGANLTANMDIVTRQDKQVIEIQFHESTLIGLTLILTKG